WDDAKGTNDYMSVYHDAANGYITTGSGGLYLSPATSSVYSRSTYPQSANNYQLGSTIGEWKNLYLGEDALSGAYFGLDQDWRMYYNETSADALILNNGTADVMAWKGGNVGIGTTAPGEALQVKGNIKILSEAAGTGKAYLLGRTVTESTLAVSAGANQYAGGSVAGDIILRTEATSQALILNSGTGASTLVVKNGKVGIGQTSPAMGLHVGTGSSSHSLTNVNDNYITGKLEVDGTSYFDGQTQHYAGLWMGDNDVALFGDGNDFSIMWGTGQATENTAILGLGNTAKSIIVTANSFRTDDFDHPAQTNPTIFVQSNEDPDNDNTKWGSVSHDNTSFVIDSGSDNITLDDSTNVAGDLSLGDNQVGTELLVIEDNGTHVVIDSVNEVYIKNNLSFNTYYGEMWYYNGTGLSLDFAVADKYYNMSYNESFVNGFVFDDAKDRLNASYGGAYRACYFASGSGQNNHEYRSSVLVNDIEQTKCRAEKDLAAGEDVTTMTGCCLLELAADDTVGVGVADVGATGAGTLFSTNLNIVRVGH
ncbi:hypothetical protein JW851_05045, partial [Candidatus Woesearchaeota archaeon]|nr:hypothetical protein [Candidatus Woesearchaeota archaeon]